MSRIVRWGASGRRSRSTDYRCLTFFLCSAKMAGEVVTRLDISLCLKPECKSARQRLVKF